jgi:hypothetical protein
MTFFGNNQHFAIQVDVVRIFRNAENDHLDPPSPLSQILQTKKYNFV